jgi:hypothetical protein
LTSPLTALTKKECSWKGGQLPPDELTAFLELQTYLCSEPIVDYPRNNRPYALIVDASLGDDKKPGGLGTILTQIDKTSSPAPAENCKSMSAITGPSYSKCKQQFGAWIILRHICKVGNSPSSQTTNL